MSKLDIAALTAKLDAFKGQDQRSSSFWKPAEGKSVVRIVPWKDRPENPFIEMHFHYLGNRTHVSPMTYGNRDPILEFAEKLRSEGTKEAYQQSRAFMPKMRTYVPIIVRGEEDQGVRFYSFGKTVYEALLSYIADPDYGDITDVKEGRDVVITFTPLEKSDTNFPKTTVMIKPNQTPLSQDKELVKKWLTVQPDITKLFKEPTYEELKVFLHRYLNPDYEETPEEESVTETVTTPEKAKSKKGPVATSIDEFDDLFDN